MKSRVNRNAVELVTEGNNREVHARFSRNAGQVVRGLGVKFPFTYSISNDFILITNQLH